MVTYLYMQSVTEPVQAMGFSGLIVFIDVTLVTFPLCNKGHYWLELGGMYMYVSVERHENNQTSGTHSSYKLCNFSCMETPYYMSSIFSKHL